MNRRQFTKLLAGAGLLLAGCRAGAAPSSSTPERKDSMQTTTQTYTRTTPIETVRNDPVFGDYGRLIFPVERSYYSGDTLEQLHLTYYNNIDPDETVDIQAGEFLMHYDEDVNSTALDESYVPDALDAVPAHASAAGMIYSFYGRLSVGNMDPDWLAEGDLPPTFYVYGTEDPFYRQFQQQYDVIRNMGISTGRIVLNGWPHGFGSDGGWVNDYAAWLESVFANKEES